MAAKEPLVITDKDQMRNWSRAMRSQGKAIGFVPTMGYLHQGHLSLIREAHEHADLIVVSIYINPGQFSPTEDLSTYPSDFDGDIQKLMAFPGGVDVVFHPHNLYDYGINSVMNNYQKLQLGNQRSQSQVLNPGLPHKTNSKNCNVKEEENGAVSCEEEKGIGHETWVRVEKLEKGLCGKSRPIFFRGVATIVTKLFNIVEPDIAMFGKKDYQQWRIIQRMYNRLQEESKKHAWEGPRSRFIYKVIGSEVVRDDDGLAMSSRNVHLSREERKKALSINRSLLRAKSAAEKGEIDCGKLRDLVIQAVNEAGGRIDYAEIVDQESLEAVEQINAPVVFCLAAWFGKVRLIDNMEIDG
ncbi:pantoate--beta-alanine ligase [Quillaja saponaria]|uniref:Pantoate--beta-alanine ligase n=1 Tax=Quillaja saponaria TaxID=32244 RepID=A0AAD7PNQ4_QUISA|nr:pantoate--beta-alanine ligase [Quillaja saponaria]